MKKLFSFALLTFILIQPVFAETDEVKEKKGGFLDSFLTFPIEGVQGVGRVVEENIFNLGPIRVTSGRVSTAKSDELVLRVPHNITVIGPAEIEQNGSVSLPEILSQQEGVSYTDDIGLGLNARVDLRGFGGEGKQALVLFDGVRAVEPVDNSVTWHLYPAEFLDSVEIQRGGGATVFGEGALSGVIQMKSKGPTVLPHVTLETALGSFSTEKVFMDASGTRGPLGVYAGARYLSTDGYRQNSDHEGVSSLVKARVEVSEFLKAENALFFADNETGIPGPLSVAEEAQNRRQKDPDGEFGDHFADKLVQDGLTLTYFLEPINAEFSNLLSYRQRNQDSAQSFGGGFPGTSISEIKTETFSDVAQVAWSTEGRHHESKIIAGFEWAKDDIHNPSVFESMSFGSFPEERAIDRRMLGAFIQHHSVVHEKWIFESGVRWDRIDWDIHDLRTPSLGKRKEASDWSPKAGVEYRFFDALSVYGSTAQAFKVPDSATLIFETPEILSPNPNIDPQTAQHYEIGARYFHPYLGSLRADVFWVQTDKEILFNDITNRNENFDTVRSGFELANEIAVSKTTQVFFNYTHTRAEFDGGAFDGKEVPLVPADRFSAGFQADPAPYWRVSAQANGHYGRFALNDFNNIFPAEDYWTMAGKAAYRRDNWEIYIRAENLFDEAYSSFTTSNAVNVENRNPSPGRTFEVGFRMEI